MTLWLCHVALFGVGMPRAVSSAAIRRADMPAVINSVRTGASCRALSIASARFAGANRSAPLRPSRMPRALAACKAFMRLCVKRPSRNAAKSMTSSCRGSKRRSKGAGIRPLMNSGLASNDDCDTQDLKDALVNAAMELKTSLVRWVLFWHAFMVQFFTSD
jgi:hypothetical protein